MNEKYMHELMTKLNEMAVDIAEIRRDMAHTTETAEGVKRDLKPVQRHVTLVEGGLALLSAAGTVGGVLKLLRVL